MHCQVHDIIHKSAHKRQTISEWACSRNDNHANEAPCGCSRNPWLLPHKGYCDAQASRHSTSLSLHINFNHNYIDSPTLSPKLRQDPSLPRAPYSKPPKSWKPDQRQLVLGFPIHYSSDLRLLGFQLLGFYCRRFRL